MKLALLASLLLVGVGGARYEATLADVRGCVRGADAPVVLCAAPKRRRNSGKPATLHDLAKESDEDEYSTDVSGDSQTVLIEPKKPDANTTAADPEPEPEPTSRMTGSGRKL